MLASGVASFYHGARRNHSFWWGLGWFVMSAFLPILTPLYAFTQDEGFGQPKKA
jgi:hypothetical protein